MGVRQLGIRIAADINVVITELLLKCGLPVRHPAMKGLLWVTVRSRQLLKMQLMHSISQYMTQQVHQRVSLSNSFTSSTLYSATFHFAKSQYFHSTLPTTFCLSLTFLSK